MAARSQRAAVVEIRGLGACFGNRWVLKDIDLDLYRGEVLSMIGASGSGKTTLLRQIIGLEEPATGSVHVHGQRVHGADRMTAGWLRRGWGVLFQHGALFSALSVFDNIAFPLRELVKSGEPMSARDIHALVMLKLEMVGLESNVAWMVPSELSGGMVKRVALARALALDADILFLDEPTAGLDPDSATEFDRLIEGLRAELGLSALMVTHDLSTLTNLSDRIVVLNEGRILAVGPLKQVIQIDHPFIKRFFHGQRGEAVLESLDN